MIEILNLKGGEVFTNRIGYIFGTCSENTIQIEDKNGAIISWPVIDNYFKVIYFKMKIKI